MARTKGATSNVLVSLKQLCDVFKLDARIPVSRRFAEQAGLLEQSKPISLTESKNLALTGEKLIVREIPEEPTEVPIRTIK